MNRIVVAGAVAALALAQVAAKPADDSRMPDTVVDTAYAVISAPAGVTRPWWRLREISAPHARFILVTPAPDGAASVQTMTTDEFIAYFGARLNGRPLYEVDCYRLKAPFSDIATMVSYYESRLTPVGNPIGRGLNSFQLIKTVDGWRIETLILEEEGATIGTPVGYPGCSVK